MRTILRADAMASLPGEKLVIGYGSRSSRPVKEGYVRILDWHNLESNPVEELAINHIEPTSFAPLLGVKGGYLGFAAARDMLEVSMGSRIELDRESVQNYNTETVAASNGWLAVGMGRGCNPTFGALLFPVHEEVKNWDCRMLEGGSEVALSSNGLLCTIRTDGHTGISGLRSSLIVHNINAVYDDPAFRFDVQGERFDHFVRAAFSPSGNILAAGYVSAKNFVAHSGRNYISARSYYSDIIRSWGEDASYCIRLWDVMTWKELPSISLDSQPLAMAWRDDDTLACGMGPRVAIVRKGELVDILNPDYGEESTRIGDLCWSPDGKILLATQANYGAQVDVYHLS